MIAVTTDPENYHEAMQSPRSAGWQQAMTGEIESLEANGTWEVVPRPYGQKMLHSKWVYKTKRHADGTLERYNARLVACENEQSHGVDYTVTFSAVLNMTTAKVVLALARVWRVPARHSDVPNAYVKAEKEDDLEIYLHLP
uniref:Reverse transcriptase Ty1/copia-type domain-containing protein n=1 Tax=Peronospora matthiolae TaxID=2874970 RepID=A0AAV1U914_9STRA